MLKHFIADLDAKAAMRLGFKTGHISYFSTIALEDVGVHNVICGVLAVMLIADCSWHFTGD